MYVNMSLVLRTDNMKKTIALLSMAGLCLQLTAQFPHMNQKPAQEIKIETNNSELLLTVGSQDRKLYQSYFGKRREKTDHTLPFLSLGSEAYIPSGLDNLFEPAICVIHSDNNPSLDLRYVSHSTDQQGDVAHSSILLKDPAYPFDVTLHYTSFYNEDVIKQWIEIRHNEKKPVKLTQFASSMLHFNAQNYWLTQFHGDWAKEMVLQENELTNGIKILDSKLGVRANQYQPPVFMLSLNKKSDEETGDIIAGTLAWSGNFRFLFEIDNNNSLRVISGMNPFNSDYTLDPGVVFRTPEFVFTYSSQGKGQASRNLHTWARNYQIMDGNRPKLTLLNNWEATGFNFNEEKLVTLFRDAQELGVDLFLLDDGWFGNKYPRSNDRAGLGDWQETKEKLPHGLGYLVEEAEKKGIKFGIWIEPEMVNPKSELYEQHPGWVLKLPNREEHLSRNQLVLDLSNPAVQDFVYGVVDGLFTKYPGIAYMKWDCNRMMTNTYSPYLKDKQSHIYIEYVKGLYNVLKRMRDKYPHVPMMVCSGGGGRVDYEALKYFTEFWPSDNTNALQRIYIQWGYSYFFPANTMSCHITSMGNQSLKFRTDVAMMGKLGYDINFSEMSEYEKKFSTEAVKTYKRLSPVIWYGDLYRLESPYEGSRASLIYVNKEKTQSVLYVFSLYSKYGDVSPGYVILKGLNPNKQYKVKEINLFQDPDSPKFEFGGFPPLRGNEGDKIYTGKYLMENGFNITKPFMFGGTGGSLSSNVYEITEITN
jgi:alpha-galactosidase